MKLPRSEVARRLEGFEAAARAARVKLTHQRLEIFREVAASLEHPDAETVFRSVKARMPTVSLDTVYRTLWLAKDLGLLSTLGPRHESVRFDANLSHHHHFVCLGCGQARDFESEELDSLDVHEAVEMYGRATATHVEVRGICNNCEKAAAPNPRSEARRRP
ncbi:MAG: Fur family transcriptional regulator [Polyangia bacterium]|mgnify:CR=1 FL=1|nr:Fur family transcriptional regulator [Polyangia bacterium]